MAKSPQSRNVTRKQQSRVEKETRQRKILLITTITIAVLVVVILGYGLLDTLVLQARRPVASVDGENISLQTFQSRVRYTRYQLIQNTVQLVQYQQIFGSDPSTSGYFSNQIQQNLLTLNTPQTMGDQVIQNLVNEVVIRKEAEKLGITVTDEEVEKAMQEAFGFYAAGTPTPQATTIPFATATYAPQQLTLVPPTATPTEFPTPTVDLAPTETSLPTATIDPAATLAPTTTPFPTATPYTLEGYQSAFDEYVTSLDTQAQFSRADFVEIFRASLLYEKVLEAVTQDVATVDDVVWARHILVATAEEAALIKERLNAGDDFAALAAEFSTDESNKFSGGDLGWFEKGMMVAEFENAAFGLTEIGQISDPVQTSFGYHIIQLLGKETRPVSEGRIQTLKQDKFNQWLETAKAGMKIELFDNWLNSVPTVPAVPAGLGTS